MTALYSVVRGKTNTAIANFSSNGVSLILNTVPTFVVYDMNDNVIIAGGSEQDSIVTSRYRSTFTIPDNAPISGENEKYSIVWTAVTNTGVQLSQTEYFIVVDTYENLTDNSNLLVLENSKFNDKLILDTVPTDFTYNITIVDEGGNAYFTSPPSAIDIVSKVIGDKQYIYANFDIISELVAGNNGVSPYFINWTFTIDGITHTEIHPLYIVSYRGMMFVNNLRKYLDKARNFDINPSLRWEDSELFHFVLQGLQRFNATEPQLTNYNLNNIPTTCYYYITKCAAHESLNALYLAEAYSKFDFQGQSVQLNVDRTPEIQTKMDEINQWLEEHMRKAKKILARHGGGIQGALVVNVGPSTNFPGLISDNSLIQRILTRSNNSFI